MKIRTARFALVLLAGSLLGPAFAAAQEGAPADPQAPAAVKLDDLGWLEGSWSGEVKGAGATTRFEAHYTAPQGGVILGSSKAFKPDGKMSWFEFERFELRDGALRVTPYPNGKASVTFTLVEYDPAAKKAVFANPEHDYPNRITYQRAAGDRLVLVVAGESKDAPVMEFTLSRQP